MSESELRKAQAKRLYDQIRLLCADVSAEAVTGVLMKLCQDQLMSRNMLVRFSLLKSFNEAVIGSKPMEDQLKEFLEGVQNGSIKPR